MCILCPRGKGIVTVQDKHVKKGCFYRCNLVGKCAVGCFLFVSFRSIHASLSQKQSSKRTLFIPLFSLSDTPMVVYIYMPHSNWEQFSFQPALHGAQSWSLFNTITFVPSTDHSPANTFTFNWPFAHTTGTYYTTAQTWCHQAEPKIKFLWQT